MLVGAELQAKADAEAAIELADAAVARAARGADHARGGPTDEPDPRARRRRRGRRCARRRRLRARCEAAEAIDALAARGIVEQALLYGATAEVEDLLAKLERRAVAARARNPPDEREQTSGARSFVARLREALAGRAQPDARRLRARPTPPVPAVYRSTIVYDDDADHRGTTVRHPASSSSRPSPMAPMIDAAGHRSGKRACSSRHRHGLGRRAARSARRRHRPPGRIAAGGRRRRNTATCVAAVSRSRRSEQRPTSGAEACRGAAATARLRRRPVRAHRSSPPAARSLPAAVVGGSPTAASSSAPLRVNGIELVLALRPTATRCAAPTDPMRLHAAAPRRRTPVALAARRGRRRDRRRRPRRRGPRRPGPAARRARRARSATRSRCAEGEHALDALLWLGLQGDPLISLDAPGQAGGRHGLGLDVLPASLLVIELGRASTASAARGCTAARARCARAARASAAGARPARPVRRARADDRAARDRTGWSLPYPAPRRRGDDDPRRRTAGRSATPERALLAPERGVGLPL